MDILFLPAVFSPINLSAAKPRISAAKPRPIVPSSISPELPPKIHKNPLRNPQISQNFLQTPQISQNPLSNKLFLSSKLSPPPPPPPPSPPPPPEPESEPSSASRFAQKGNIFVGDLPLWIKKNEIADFFRQFGPMKSVVLIKGDEDPEWNVGYCFVIFGGPTAEKAVELDRVEFWGRAMTVRLDYGRRARERKVERERWVRGEVDWREFQLQWHEERGGACRRFRNVLDSHPESWQAVVSAFERIPKEFSVSSAIKKRIRAYGQLLRKERGQASRPCYF